MTADLTLDGIFKVLEEVGTAHYGGEAISQLEHALQSALAAERAGEDETIVTAALLHDFGHLCQQVDGKHDDRHQEVGARALAHLFGQDVIAPIALHVAAKRFLCATDQHYFDSLSDVSRHSLALQGGVFTPAQAQDFRANPHADAAIRVRRYDDIGKALGLATPPLEHYRAIAKRVARIQR